MKQEPIPSLLDCGVCGGKSRTPHHLIECVNTLRERVAVLEAENALYDPAAIAAYVDERVRQAVAQSLADRNKPNG